MHIDKASFLILVSTIAAAGAGGWFARDRLVLRSEAKSPTPEPSPPPAPAPPASQSAAAADKPAPPPCEDDEGAVPECTGIPYPGDEDACGQAGLAVPRCAQYREAFKPKVARAAIECLKRLRGNQVCDPVLVNKCGHEALMAACPPELSSAAASEPSELERTCSTILTACKDATPGPTQADCMQTLSGMTDTGRKKMVACMQKLCDARGLYGCEAR